MPAEKIDSPEISISRLKCGISWLKVSHGILHPLPSPLEIIAKRDSIARPPSHPWAFRSPEFTSFLESSAGFCVSLATESHTARSINANHGICVVEHPLRMHRVRPWLD